MQAVLPAVQLGLVIEPVLGKHRQNVVVHDLAQPFLVGDVAPAEVAVADTEAAPERAVACYLSIEFPDPGNQLVEHLVVERLLVSDEALGVETRLHLEKN